VILLVFPFAGQNATVMMRDSLIRSSVVYCLFRGKNDLKLPLIYIAFALQASVYGQFHRGDTAAPSGKREFYPFS
jgi:hypothetical protein